MGETQLDGAEVREIERKMLHGRKLDEATKRVLPYLIESGIEAHQDFLKKKLIFDEIRMKTKEFSMNNLALIIPVGQAPTLNI